MFKGGALSGYCVKQHQYIIYFQSLHLKASKQESDNKQKQAQSRQVRLEELRVKSYPKEKKNQRFMATEGGKAHNVSPNNANCTARRQCCRQNWLPSTLQHVDGEFFSVVLLMLTANAASSDRQLAWTQSITAL